MVPRLNMKVKEQTLRAKTKAKATIDFAVATMKKGEQMAQQNAFHIFLLEDKLIICDITRHLK